MQPYFDPTRKTTSKKNENDLTKNEKWKMTSKKMKMEVNLNVVLLASFVNGRKTIISSILTKSVAAENIQLLGPGLPVLHAGILRQLVHCP